MYILLAALIILVIMAVRFSNTVRFLWQHALSPSPSLGDVPGRASKHPAGAPVLRRMSSDYVARIQAWQINAYGGADQLTLNPSAQTPAVKSPDELLVKVHAASVNPIDAKMLGNCYFSCLKIHLVPIYCVCVRNMRCNWLCAQVHVQLVGHMFTV